MRPWAVKHRVGLGLLAGSLLACTGCATANNTQLGTAVGAGYGALAGAIVGSGSGHGAGGAVIGALAGATAGNLIGAAEDAREDRDAAYAYAAAREMDRQAITNFDLIRMSQSGVGDTVIVNSVRSRGGNFDLSPDGVIALKNSGVSDYVISEIQQLAIRQPAEVYVPRQPSVVVIERPAPVFHAGFVVGPHGRHCRR